MKKLLVRIMQSKSHSELIEIIEKQNKLIEELINENVEKENMVNVLMSDEFSDV